MTVKTGFLLLHGKLQPPSTCQIAGETHKSFARDVKTNTTHHHQGWNQAMKPMGNCLLLPMYICLRGSRVHNSISFYLLPFLQNHFISPEGSGSQVVFLTVSVWTTLL